MKSENFDVLLELIMDNLYFSYSSLSTFENCKYCYKLSYIDRKEPKENNFFGEYGLLTHDTIEQYFNNNLESYELSNYFKENYKKTMITPPPPFPAGMEEKYIEQGEEFFNNFYFDRDSYEILKVESEIKFNISGTQVVGRPDLILKEKSTGKNILLDYKTSIPFRYDKKTGKEMPDKKKIDGYFRQMYLYCYGLKKTYKIKIDKITIWFTRINKELTIKWNKEEEEQAINWAKSLIKEIKKEKEFRYNNTNTYFCNFLCGVRNHCKYKKEMM